MILEKSVGGRSTRRKLRVAWLTSSPTPYKLPFFQQLSAREDLEIHFIFLTWSSASRDWKLDDSSAGIDYEVLPGVNLRTSVREKNYIRWNPDVITALTARPWHAVVISGYNHPTMLRAILACVRQGIPFILQGESHVVKKRGSLKQGIKKALLYPLLRKAAGALATGTMARKYWQEVGIPEEKIFTVGNVPDVAWYLEKEATVRHQREAAREELQLDDRPCGIFVGRFINVKGVDILLEGLAQLSPCRRPQLLLVGDGPMRERLEELVEEEGLPVQFLGFRQPEELPRLYAAADFFVLPSREEPWGVVVNEAALCGLPLFLSSQVGAAYDILEAGSNGCLVVPNTAEAWADALQEAFSTSSDRLKEMGHVSRGIASAWDYNASEREFMRAVEVAARSYVSA